MSMCPVLGTLVPSGIYRTCRIVAGQAACSRPCLGDRVSRREFMAALAGAAASRVQRPHMRKQRRCLAGPCADRRTSAKPWRGAAFSENTAPSSSWHARVERRRVTPWRSGKPASMANLTGPSACEMPENFGGGAFARLRRGSRSIEVGGAISRPGALGLLDAPLEAGHDNREIGELEESMAQLDVLIRNGTVATAADVSQCDVAISSGKVVALVVTSARRGGLSMPPGSSSCPGASRAIATSSRWAPWGS